jgi:uncharacterized sporulation protein YeaH/YhbH (DUF444 family)
MTFSDDEKLVARLKEAGLSPEQEARIRRELETDGSHDLPAGAVTGDAAAAAWSDRGLYGFHDPETLQGLAAMQGSASASIRSIDELLERDRQREQDGFPRKINVGRLIKPGRSGKEKVVIVPTTVEEKLLHDTSFRTEEEQSHGGSGEGEEGEVIGEQPVREEQQPGAAGPGQGEGGPHELESNAYDLGRILTEKFQLPHLKDKGKKRSLTRYTYDLTDRHRGFGQLLDKKATLRKILETNLHLGNIPDVNRIDPSRFLVAPEDKVYRVLSPEKDYESQALVFFLRDYSGSMEGQSTVLVVAQHVMIYSWLMYQYAMQVETRFILHDTQAKEVPDFYTYYNSKVAGGTQVSSAYQLVNEIVERENLIRDYNIYVFHGTDGDDWDHDGSEAIPQLRRMLAYANRVGITIAQHGRDGEQRTEVEKYIRSSGLLEERAKMLRMDVMQEDANEPRLIEGIKKLIAE